MQLINPAIYDQVAQQRAKAIEQSTEQRRQQKSMKEKAKLNKHFHAIQAHGQTPTGIQTPTTPQSYEIEIDNIRFRVADGGSKLIRISSTWMDTGKRRQNGCTKMQKTIRTQLGPLPSKPKSVGLRS